MPPFLGAFFLRVAALFRPGDRPYHRTLRDVPFAAFRYAGQLGKLMPLVFPLLAMLRKLWGRTPGLRGTPSSRIRNNGVSVLQGASRPTGASAAVQGDRPTIYAGAQHRKNEWHWFAKLPHKRG